MTQSNRLEGATGVARTEASNAMEHLKDTKRVSYNTKDVMLYALGIGCSAEDLRDLRFLYEGHGDFCVFPTFVLSLPFKGAATGVVEFPGPALSLIPPELKDKTDASSILHYDQCLQMLSPLDSSGATLRTRSELIGVYQRRGGVLSRTRNIFVDQAGRTLAISTQGVFLRGLRIEGDVGPPLPKAVKPNLGVPDVVVVADTSPEQALLYRLSGDYNPIHADADVARAVGLEGPILHGLCTFGVAARRILQNCCPDDPSSLTSISGRFSSVVYPGEALEVMLWLSPSADTTRGYGTGTARAHAAWPTRVEARASERDGGGRQDGESFACELVLFEVCAPSRKRQVVLTDGRATIRRSGAVQHAGPGSKL